MNLFFEIETPKQQKSKLTQSIKQSPQKRQKKECKLSFSNFNKLFQQKHQQNYHWHQQEQRKYINYLLNNQKKFELSPKERRLSKIHQKMSKFLNNRNAAQCRSHHQQQLQKHGSIYNIINNNIDLLWPLNLQKFKKIQNEVLSKVNNGAQQNIQRDKNIKNINIQLCGQVQSSLITIQKCESSLFQKLIEK